MNFQALPTDNLYKFMTFLGLASFLFCAWYLNDGVKKIELNGVVIEAKLDSLERLATSASREIDYYNGLLTDEKKLAEVKDIVVAELRIKIPTYQAILKEAEDLRGAGSKSALELQQFKYEMRFIYIGLYGGALTFISGLIAWYYLHQRFQDRLIRRQALERTR